MCEFTEILFSFQQESIQLFIMISIGMYLVVISDRIRENCGVETEFCDFSLESKTHSQCQRSQVSLVTELQWAHVLLEMI